VVAGLASALLAGEPIIKDRVAAPIMEGNLQAQKISAAIRTPKDRIGDMEKKGKREKPDGLVVSSPVAESICAWLRALALLRTDCRNHP
jgi:hypothetical protein